jgi:uncharacterized protein YecE (DUF72 family)
MEFAVERDRERLKQLAAKGVYLGTSSWIYEGWLGQVYNGDYSGPRSKVNKKRFETECLVEHSQIFPTVCFDGAYYRFPETKKLEQFREQIAPGGTMAFKVTQDVTLREIKDFQTKQRHSNEGYLRGELFEERFLRPVAEVMGEKLGPMIFEFSPFFFGRGHGQLDYTPLQFVKDLHQFFERIPKNEFQYAVEVRDPQLITFERYYDCLEFHGVAHVLNQQTWVPEISEQIDIPGVFPAPYTVIRALVRPGVKHEEAVDEFQPYNRTQLDMPQMREAIAEVARRSLAGNRKMYAYINNRTEGNAPNTIAGILDLLIS